MYIVAGLGNPGNKYELSRHNVGFKVIDMLAKRYNIGVNKIEFKGLTGQGLVQGNRVVFIKPQTFMNNSGRCVYEIFKWYKISPEKLIVVYDDMDLEIGKVRVRKSGSAGGHKGMKSIIYMLQSHDFPRVRVGIGHPAEEQEVVDHVLSEFDKEEQSIMDESIKKAVYAIETMLVSGIDISMNRYNC